MAEIFPAVYEPASPYLWAEALFLHSHEVAGIYELADKTLQLAYRRRLSRTLCWVIALSQWHPGEAEWSRGCRQLPPPAMPASPIASNHPSTNSGHH